MEGKVVVLKSRSYICVRVGSVLFSPQVFAFTNYFGQGIHV